MEADQGVWMTQDGLYHRGSPKRTIPNGQGVQRAGQHQPQSGNANFCNNNEGGPPPAANGLSQQRQHPERRLISGNPERRPTAGNPSERCTCCPYGYHIDLDFMRICDEISTGVNLKEIKKPSRRGRRKFGSMPNDHITPPVPPRSSSVGPERTLHQQQQQQHRVRQIGFESTASPSPSSGEDTLSKENQEFWDIYHQFDEHLRTTYDKKPSSKLPRNRIPSDTQSLPPEPLDMNLSDVESICSDIVQSPRRHQGLGSQQSAMSSLRTNLGHQRDHRHRQEPMRVNLRDMANLRDMSSLSSSNTSLSSNCSSNSGYSPLPFGGVYSSLPNVNITSSATSSGRSTPCSTATLTNHSDLSRIRQQMAKALIRMKQLEGQVKVIPTFQVKINVLKEEKRLLKMQIKKQDLDHSRDAQMKRDSLDLQQLEEQLLAREADLYQKESILNKKELDLNEGALQKRELDLEARGEELEKREQALERLQEQCQQREVELAGRESNIESGGHPHGLRELEFIKQQQSELRLASPSSVEIPNDDNQRPSTLEELAEKLNNLKRAPPPVAPKPQTKGPPRKAVVQPYVHTKSVGINVDTFECSCKHVDHLSKDDRRQSAPQPYRNSLSQAYQGGIHVTMWKPDSMPQAPVPKSTQTDEGPVFRGTEYLYAPLTGASATQTNTTPTVDWGVAPHITTSEFQTQTIVDTDSPSVQQWNLQTQTNVTTCDTFVEAIEPKVTSCDTATSTVLNVLERGTTAGQSEMRQFSSCGTVTDVVQKRHMAVNTEAEEILPLVAPKIEPKVTHDKGTFTAQDVRDRSTSVEQAEEHEVYNRGTMTDVLQKRHMAVNTEETEEPAIVPAAQSLVMSAVENEVRSSQGRNAGQSKEPVVTNDASVGTEVSFLRTVGAVRDASVEALCETCSQGVSAVTVMEDQSSLASTDIRDSACGPDSRTVAEVSTVTDTLDMNDAQTHMDKIDFRTYSTNTEQVVTAHAACAACVTMKEQGLQVEGVPDIRQVSQVDTGSGDSDVNVLVCDECTKIQQGKALVSTSDNDIYRTRTIGMNHSIVTRSIGTGDSVELMGQNLVMEGGVGGMCNACRRNMIGQEDDGPPSFVSIGVGGDTTLEKITFADSFTKQVLQSEASPTNRSFPATNPNERRHRPRSNSTPALPTGGIFSFEECPVNQQPSAKLSFPAPPDFSNFKWSSTKGTPTDEGTLLREDGSSDPPTSEGEDTTLEESTESIFRAEEVVFRRNPDAAIAAREAASIATATSPLCAIDEDSPMAIAFSNPYFMPAGQSPLDPPIDGIDGVQYNRQTSQESSSAPQSTTQSLSSLVTSSDDEEESEEGSSSSDESACFSTTTEGSYDGHTGRVHVKRRRVTPTKKGKQFVYPQKVPLSPMSFQACQVIDKHVTQPEPDTQDKEYVASLSSILREWFEISSQENSEVEHVQGYLLSLADVSKEVVKKIINMADGNGNTALHYSISHGNFDIVDALLGSGVCEVNKPNKAGATAIMLTALAHVEEEDDWMVVEKLVASAEVNIRSTQAGQTTLMLAVSRGKVRMVRLLLEAGADVNTQDEDGSTALMCASEHGHLDIVKLLIGQSGCDIAVSDSDGCNAFSIAMENGHKAIGVLLYAHMNFGKQSTPKKRLAGSPSGRISGGYGSLQQSARVSASSQSLTQDAPPPSKQSSRSRSLSPASRQSALHSSRTSKYQRPTTPGSSQTPAAGKATPSTRRGRERSGSTTATPTQTRGRSSPQGGFNRNASSRKSLPAKSQHSDDGGIVRALRKSKDKDPQSKYKSV